MRRLVPLLLLLAAGPAAAQTADQLYRTNPLAALAQIEANGGALTGAQHRAAARAALAAGWITGELARSVTLYERAARHARAALALDSLDADAHFWLAAAVGRRAQVADEGVSKTASRADTAYRAATRALELDSLHAGAHNVLGQLHMEVLKTPAALRFIAFRILGLGPEFESSWQQAHDRLLAAARLAPNEVIARVEIARYYVRRGEDAAALPHLQAALELPTRHPQDVLLKRDAAELLRKSSN